jgi:hypothetical protein
MCRYAVLLVAVVLLGCTQTPKESDSDASGTKERQKRKVTARSDSGKKPDQKAKKDGGKSDGDKKPDRTGPPSKDEVKQAVKDGLPTAQGFSVANVDVTSVSQSMEVPEKKKQALAAPSVKGVWAYYVDFTANNLDAGNEKFSSKNYLVLVAREASGGVKLLACYKDPVDYRKKVVEEMGQDWLDRNPPPK